MKCLVCGSADFGSSFTVTRPDPYRALLGADAPLARYHECRQCEGMIFEGDARAERVYETGDYYGVESDPQQFLRRRFDQVAALPPERSDNQARIARIRAFLAQQPQSGSHRTQCVADIGAGMGIFLYGFVEEGWHGTAIEPDPQACAFMRARLPHLEVIVGYSQGVTHSRQYDVITLNRVLEHVTDPRGLLLVEAAHLAPGGILYIEVPDVASFYHDGPNNEAFGYTHFVVFSPLTLAITLRDTPLELLALNRVREPSGKFTLYGFARARASQPR